MKLNYSEKCSDIRQTDTGVNRGTLTRMYYEKVERIELEVLDILCDYFNCTIGELLEPQKPGVVTDTETSMS